jgi:tetraacyldisaccharide 4'-kinase
MRVRRRRMERRPERQRRLAGPVISVGNLSVGGTGKTPVVAAIAQWLVDAGERPAILSRGYGRADAADGVVVVSDGRSILAGVERAGDEPLMLARQVPRAAVCVSPDRHLAGTLAERQLDCTVHVLDDGFQHLALARGLDVLVTTIGESPTGRVLPMGRLREPIDAASRAHVLVVTDATAGAASAEAWTLGISQSCGAARSLAAPVAIATESGNHDPGSARVIAVAGIANPQRFFDALKAAGHVIAGEMAFPDHHRYTAADVAAIGAKMQALDADAIVTTDKDAVRLETLELPMPAYRVPLTIAFDPPDVLFASVRTVLA